MQGETKGRSLAEVLLNRGVVAPQALEEARTEAEAANLRLENVLLQKNLISGLHMVLALSEYLDIPPVTLAHFTPDSSLMDVVPYKTLKQLQIVPMARRGDMLMIAMADPFDLNGVELLHHLTNLEIVPLVAPEKEVADALVRFAKEPTQGLEEILRDMAEGEVEVGRDQAEEITLDEMMEIAEEAPVIRIVNSIMVEALRKRASDIHIEPMEKTLRLRYRIDGILYESPSPPKRLHAAICSRIKILSNLNIAERRTPQDGRFKIKAMGKEADVRVSLLPTVHGEKIVMRILDKTSLAPSLRALGLDPKAFENFCYAIQQPHGMLLVTGPTGSGKTTTLYSALQDLNKPDVNIITVEDPVEYQLPGINQVQTHAEVGLTFASGLRSILRQDPDIVMVGEIRDGETATIAVQAALTGHLVLSTLHTNDAAGAIARMVNMGIEPFLLASSLIMTQAQRLYRKLCTACRQPMKVTEEMLALNHLPPDALENAAVFQARGCPKCGNLGYKGRAALMEILMMNEEIRAQMMKDANAALIREIAVRSGMLTLRDMGLQRVREGITSLDEVLRVTSGD